MNKLLLLSFMAVCLVILMSTKQAIAQEDESTSVHITIKEDGKVTTDTTFELKEGQDPDMVKKMVQHMVGEDDCKHKELAWIHADGDDVWHVESMDMGIDMDSLKEAHGGEKVMVFKDEDGEKVKIKKMKTEGGNMMIISEDEHVEWTEEDGEKVDVYVIKKGDKNVKVVKKVTVEIEDESEEDVEKEVEVEVEVEVKAEKKK